jgi:hypothetical protein
VAADTERAKIIQEGDRTYLQVGLQAMKGEAPRDGKLLPLHGRLSALRQGAFALTRQIQNLRNAQRVMDRHTLERGITSFEHHVAALADEGARGEGGIALEEKRKALARLEEMERAESRCIMRLAKIEAVLDTTTLTLRGVQAGVSAAPTEEALRRELDAEVAAIWEVSRDLPAGETLHMQALGHRR